MINLSDNIIDQKQNLISLINDQAVSEIFEAGKHFAATHEFLCCYGCDGAEINQTLNGWQSVVSQYIKSEVFDKTSCPIAPPILLKPENNAQLCQYLSIIADDFKEKYNCIINETIAYDKKMCALLSKNIGVKIDELFSKFNQINAPDKPDKSSACITSARRKDKFAGYHQAIEKNNQALINEIQNYLDNDEISEILFRTGEDNKKDAVRHSNISANFKINISDALNLIDKFGERKKVISFSVKSAFYAAIKINYDYAAIDYKNLTSIIVIKLKSPASPCELKFLNLAASFYAANDERIAGEIETKVNTIKFDLLKKIAMPHEAFLSINDYFNELFKTLCS